MYIIALPHSLGVQLNEYLQGLSKQTLPPGHVLDCAGPSRQYLQESSGFLAILAVALIVIYLSLAALFESFWDQFIILISVPMSLVGALIFIALGVGGASINIYTEAGLVTLMGLISKHGILIVDFLECDIPIVAQDQPSILSDCILTFRWIDIGAGTPQMSSG